MDDNAAFSQEVLEYVLENEHIDPYTLALKKSPFPKVEMNAIAQQIQGRQIAKNKFPFLLDIQQYRYPKKESLEQASSEMTGRYKSNLINGESFVDLTGGMGIDTFLLGGKFKESVYVEPNVELYTSTKQNFIHLGFDQCRTFNTTSEDFLESNTKRYGWVYIDPSRRVGGSRKTSIHNYEPNIVELQDKIKSVANNILVKLSPMQDISECVSALDDVHKIWVLSIQNEVKELLIHIRPNMTIEPQISAIDISQGQETEFSYLFNDRQSQIDCGEVKKYIYQPSAALVKSQLNNKYASDLLLEKLNANTQLYTSDTLTPEFFGRIFIVRQKIQMTKKVIKEVLPKMKANVISKNFPLSPQELKRKYQLKDGGEDYLIAYTDHKDNRVAIVCERLK